MLRRPIDWKAVSRMKVGRREEMQEDSETKETICSKRVQMEEEEEEEE